MIPASGFYLVKLFILPARGGRGARVPWRQPRSQNALHITGELYAGTILQGTDLDQPSIGPGAAVLFDPVRCWDVGDYEAIVPLSSIVARFEAGEEPEEIDEEDPEPWAAPNKAVDR